MAWFHLSHSSLHSWHTCPAAFQATPGRTTQQPCQQPPGALAASASTSARARRVASPSTASRASAPRRRGSHARATRRACEPRKAFLFAACRCSSALRVHPMHQQCSYMQGARSLPARCKRPSRAPAEATQQAPSAYPAPELAWCLARRHAALPEHGQQTHWCSTAALCQQPVVQA